MLEEHTIKNERTLQKSSKIKQVKKNTVLENNLVRAEPLATYLQLLNPKILTTIKS